MHQTHYVSWSTINTFLLAISLSFPLGTNAEEDGAEKPSPPAEQQAQCDTYLTGLENPPKAVPAQPSKKRIASNAQGKKSQTASATAETAPALGSAATTPARQGQWTLWSFLVSDPAQNLAIQHPFTLANAAEKAYALITHVPYRMAMDPLYKVKKVPVYPTLSGEHPASGGRMVVGQEETIAAFVAFLGSVARGDRSGMSLGIPGPAGTGKTELLYVLDQLEKNLGKEDKYKQLSYRFKGLYNIPHLRYLFKWIDGKPVSEYFDPELPRSPFTLLREDMQERVLATARPMIQSKWNMTITEGWHEPEPKTDEIIRAIFEHHYPEIAEGKMTVHDLSEQEYLDTLSKYVIIVPKTLVQPQMKEANVIRAQTENANFNALFVAPNIGRLNIYGNRSAFSVDYTGQIVQQDGRLLMFDELFRNGHDLLNVLLEVIQNRIVSVDWGRPVHLDTLPVWNSNDESIELARENGAIKALLDRTDQRPMRSLLAVNQIESVVLFQIGLKKFKMRRLDETELRPLVHSEVYPPVDARGNTQTAHGRYALYYDLDGQDILISPYALNYMAWLAGATRFVTDLNVIKKYASDLNLVRGNPGLFQDAIGRIQINIGDKSPEPADRMELSKLVYLAEEGSNGIGSRMVEKWWKEAMDMVRASGKSTLTPNIVDRAFEKLLTVKSINPTRLELRAEWQILREKVKLRILLPKLDREVKAIVSGDGTKAERLYDQVEKQFIALADKSDATEFTPEDGSESILIDHGLLDSIRAVYRNKFKRDFQPNFLLRQLSGARAGHAQRDSDLLEAIRTFLAEKERSTAEHVIAFERYFRNEATDPETRRRVAEVEPILASYGYNSESFQEAVAFVSQLHKAEELARKRQENN